jgi:tetratricopeptide (TPR) repeat protein
VFDTASWDPEVADVVEAQRAKVVADPRSHEAWGRLGMALLANGLVDEAEDCFIEAGRLAPGEPRWIYYRTIWKRETAPEEAAAHLRRAIAIAGDNAHPEMRLRLAEILIERGLLDEAEAEAEATPETEESAAHLCGVRGVLAARRGDWRRCVDLLTPLTASQWVRAQATLLLASAHGRLGNTALAEQLAHAAHALPPDLGWPDPYWEETKPFARSRSAKAAEMTNLRGAGLVAEARALLERAGEPGGKDTSALAIAAVNLSRAGRIDLAERVARQAVADDPEYRPGLLALCMVLDGRAGPARGGAATDLWLEVEALAGRGLRANPNDTWLLFLRGKARAGLGRRDGALADLRAATVCRPDLLPAQRFLGETALAAGLLSEAREALTRARKLAPDDGHVQAALRRLEAAEAAKKKGP